MSLMAKADADRRAKQTIAGVVLVVVAIFAYKVITEPPKVDCRAPSAMKTVILVDRSEGLSAQTIEEIVVRSVAHVRGRPVNERVSIFAIGDSSATALLPLYDGCRPRMGDEASGVTQDVLRLQRQFQKSFIDPITAELRKTVAPSHWSPIAQAITDLSLGNYLNGPENHLLVFSDMLEHTARFSVYHCASVDQVISDFRAARAGAVERPTFQNTTVTLNIIPRSDLAPSTLACRDRLWPWFFGDMKGTTNGLDVRYLPGGAPN